MVQASRDRVDYIEVSGTAAERTAFNNPRQAMEWYETDTTARYKYLSGAWVLVASSGGAAPGYGSGGGGGGGGTATYTLTAPASVVVGITDTSLIPANPSRKALFIQVNGASDVALTYTASAATLAAGTLLSANERGAGYPGGSIGPLAHLGPVRGIARNSASSITWWEGV